MDNICGSRRTIGQDLLPVYAWRLDNRKNIMDDEILIRLSKIHIEPSSFSKMCKAAMGQEELIKENIINIVKERGKVHNPYTETAGLVAGTIEAIGKKCTNTAGFKPGDEVLVIVSASMIPVYLDRVSKVNFAYGNLDVDGHAIIFDKCPMVKKDRSLSWDLLLLAFEESASIFNVSKLATKKDEVLILGDNLITSVLYGLAVRKTLDKSGKLVMLYNLDNLKELSDLERQKLNKLLDSVFDEVYFLDTGDAIDCADKLTHKGGRYFDIVVNCADKAGAEAVSVLVTKEKGTVFFSNLANKYNTALFIQESIYREMNLECAAGYYDGYDVFLTTLLKENAQYLQRVGDAVCRLRKLFERPIYGDLLDNSNSKQMICSLLNYESSNSMLLADDIKKAGKYDCNVVITGESGSGKEVVANLIYQMSDRKSYPFIKVNCAAIPDNLMESEFFGYEKGAFTGASEKGKSGFFSRANNGVLLLDEITELSLEMQAKLLRVIQEGEFYKLGGETPIYVDVRVIAISNKNLREMMALGKFREDLYYRLSVINIDIPPLRERLEDIEKLTKIFLERYSLKYGGKVEMSPEALSCWEKYDWPGNVRQLENATHRLYIDAEGDIIEPEDVMRYFAKHGNVFKDDNGKDIAKESYNSFNEQVSEFEKNLIRNALIEFGSTRKAAESLSMTQSQLMRKKQKLGI